MPTIIFVCNTAWGLYQFRKGVLCELILRGVRVIALAPRDESTLLLKAMGCETIDVEISAKGLNPIKDLLLLRNLYKIYSRISPDFVFHYTVKPNIYGTLAAVCAGVPSISVTTGLGYAFIAENLISKIVRRMYKLAFLFPKEVWFLNEDDKLEFLRRGLVCDQKVRVLAGEGVNTAYFSSPSGPVRSGATFSFLMIARLLWDKGVAEYVEAARILRKLYPDARFQLLGATGVQNPSAVGKDLVDSWVEEGCIEYAGVTSDVRPFVLGADCVVLPSYREGVPRTLLEAAAMKRPLVATNVPGCRDVVVDGVNGYLCEPKSHTSLAHALERIMTLSDDERRRMGEASRKHVCAQFEERIVIRQYLETLEGYGVMQSGMSDSTQESNGVPYVPSQANVEDSIA